MKRRRFYGKAKPPSKLATMKRAAEWQAPYPGPQRDAYQQRRRQREEIEDREIDASQALLAAILGITPEEREAMENLPSVPGGEPIRVVDQ